MNLEQAAQELEKGNIIVYPTETSYALGVDATNSEAVEKIFNIKKRDKGKALSIIVSSIEMIEKYAVINDNARKLVAKLMPGPLTLVVPVKKRTLPENLCKDSVAFRISSNKIANEICSKLGKPITATSANLSGNEPIYNIEEVRKQFPNLLVIDTGNLPKNKVSTVYNTISKKVLRKGPVSAKEIDSVF